MTNVVPDNHLPMGVLQAYGIPAAKPLVNRVNHTPPDVNKIRRDIMLRYVDIARAESDRAAKMEEDRNYWRVVAVISLAIIGVIFVGWIISG